jgi:uncharacterized protein YfkK (UPF0435 family)
MFYRHNFKGGKDKVIQEKIITPTNDRGYLKVVLSVNGKRHLRYIHRLVAEAFIPNPNSYREVNHIDSNPSNCCVDNLEWCDRKYNIDYMLKHQEAIKDRHERRMEALEDIYYLATSKETISSAEILGLISKDLLGDY